MTAAHSVDLVKHWPIFNPTLEKLWHVNVGKERKSSSDVNTEKKESLLVKGDLDFDLLKLSRSLGSSRYFLVARSSRLTGWYYWLYYMIILTDLVWLPQWHHIRCVHKVIQSFLYEILRLIACELRYSAMQMSRWIKKMSRGIQGYIWFEK